MPDRKRQKDIRAVCTHLKNVYRNDRAYSADIHVHKVHNAGYFTSTEIQFSNLRAKAVCSN